MPVLGRLASQEKQGIINGSIPSIIVLNALARRDDDGGEMDRATAANGDMDSREPSAILAAATKVRRMRNTIKLGRPVHNGLTSYIRTAVIHSGKVFVQGDAHTNGTESF